MPHIVPHTMLHTMPHTMPHTKPHTMQYTMPHAVADTDTHTDTDIICHNNVTTTLNFATPYTIIHECNDITMLKQNYTIIHASPMLLHNLNTKCFNNMLLLPNKAQYTINLCIFSFDLCQCMHCVHCTLFNRSRNRVGRVCSSVKAISEEMSPIDYPESVAAAVVPDLDIISLFTSTRPGCVSCCCNWDHRGVVVRRSTSNAMMSNWICTIQYNCQT